MKVAIIGSRGYPYVYSGYETLIKHLAEGLVEKGVEVTVYCHKGLFSERPKTVNGVNLAYIPTVETKSLSQLLHSLLSFIHLIFNKPDVLFVVNAANGPYGLISKLFRIPTAINVDGLEWLRPKWKGLGAKYFKWSAKQATKFYDLIINDSEEMKRVYQETFHVDSEVIAYGGIIRKSKAPELIEKWELKSNDYYLIVGRLIPDNNADLIIEGFINSGSSKKLVVVGDVPYTDEYASKIKGISDERLVFTGYVTNQNELAELYHQAFGYFHGHEYGGTNPTMLKALAYGSAILALNTAFNQEMLNGGEFGRFFEKNAKSVTHLVNSMEANASEMAMLKQNSPKGITKKYTWEYVVEQYYTAFQKLRRN
ncbi:glycosyltransferase involved in cell wall biosynthesis [Roseivirga pacifica]|uniref:Glycosyltransferase involved in cell wall bisynthesis n=1 Tax=Roseivirga pacifica TaxID=1267423 RepID=A0A1I0N7W7_9BACT|nr:DUF1972 domain-containing protein [Roseivirga pacifica]RKQ50975.1 glycosyltransferase involved in cell wall biosynthesis [Roseivirga pacifica]SEV96967.1 Glycosyltransferase involved in cell wall bisynthesis [Roseivirga pacifica]